LIVISNRVSPGGGNQAACRRAFGGLREHGGIWFGWSGQETPEFTGHINFQRVDGVTTATIDLEEQDIDEYYNGYANRTLWPLCHYRIDLAEYERSFAGGYQRANERFADTVRPDRG
jgi:trehalose 6-phosphate synthase